MIEPTIPLILVGGGGHCLSCIDVVESTGRFHIIGIVDIAEKAGTNVLGYPVIGCDDDIPRLVADCPHFLITVGQIKTPGLRKKLSGIIKDAGGDLPVIISPNAYVSPHAIVEEGSIVMHRALVNAGAHIGRCCIINTLALVEHETRVGDYCHISTAACLNGQVTIGEETFIGSNAVIGNNLTVAPNTLVAAGSQVLKNLVHSGTYLGYPLRRI